MGGHVVCLHTIFYIGFSDTFNRQVRYVNTHRLTLYGEFIVAIIEKISSAATGQTHLVRSLPGAIFA
jgi:hypothetical protein